MQQDDYVCDLRQRLDVARRRPVLLSRLPTGRHAVRWSHLRRRSDRQRPGRGGRRTRASDEVADQLVPRLPGARRHRSARVGRSADTRRVPRRRRSVGVRSRRLLDRRVRAVPRRQHVVALDNGFHRREIRRYLSPVHRTRRRLRSPRQASHTDTVDRRNRVSLFRRS